MSTVEERLNVLEEQVSLLSQQVSKAGRNGNWLDRVAGSFRDDPEFDEILRLGKLFREQYDANDLEDVVEG